MTAKRLPSVFFSALLTSLLFGSIPAISQEPAEEWALKIVDRRVDEATRQLFVTLWNGSELEVTAFGVSIAHRGPGGRGPTTVMGRSFLFLGDGIGPRESREVPAGHWSPDGPEPSWSRVVELAYEILEDNSAHGNERSIEREFAARRAVWAELDAALGCLREGAGSVELSGDFLALLEDVRACGEKTLERLAEKGPSGEPVGGAVLWSDAARSEVANLTDQMRKRFEAGDSADFLISSMDQLLEEDLARRARGLRPSDLERLGR